MARTKEKKHANGIKRELDDNSAPVKPADARPSKKVKLLDDSDEGSDSEEGGVTLKVNEEYARRFEYNKKREEKHRRMFHSATILHNVLSANCQQWKKSTARAKR